jgi:hypothetical protein
MSSLDMIFVCILVLDIQDLCALPTHYARVLRWAVPGSIASFVSLVMITSQRNALVDDYDHRLSPIRCCFFTTKSRPVRAWQHSSYRNLQKLETRSMTDFRGFTLLQSSENVTNLRSPQHTCRSSSIACVSTITLQSSEIALSVDARSFATRLLHLPFIALAGSLKHPGLRPGNGNCMHPESPCDCLQVGYCRMFLSGAASHAAFASVASGMARRQACAVKRQTMTCRWWRFLAFVS